MSSSNLKTSVEQLKGYNDKSSNFIYRQCVSNRDVTDDSFDINDKKWYTPKESYIRLKMKLSDSVNALVLDSNVLTLDKNIYPNMFLPSTMYQSMDFKIHNRSISKINDYLSKTESLDIRL